jgi:CheY-like chemotaxis protein
MKVRASISGGRILIVDDHVELAENLAEILEGAGYLTTVAASAEAGLEAVGRGDVLAVVTDYRLPGMNGAQLIAELRRRGILIPAVMISAFADDQAIARATAAALQNERWTAQDPSLIEAAQWEKPVEVEQLLTWVAGAVERGATERPRR